MEKHEDIQYLQDQPTLLLLVKGICTFGIYQAYYIKRIVDKTNQIIAAEEQQIGYIQVYVFILLSYFTAFTSLSQLWTKLPEDLLLLNQYFSIIWAILAILLSFRIGYKLNKHFKLYQIDRTERFHGVWIILFTYLYINYKINKLNKRWDFVS
ncbi:MAG: DUF4234 domain-containing protein [Lentisphaeria bacterium]|nr:DUF4234 domain-containing protein [Lentisphaeria bacterium]